MNIEPTDEQIHIFISIYIVTYGKSPLNKRLYSEVLYVYEIIQ